MHSKLTAPRSHSITATEQAADSHRSKQYRGPTERRSGRIGTSGPEWYDLIGLNFDYCEDHY